MKQKKITLLMLCLVLASTLLLSACDIGGFHIELLPTITTPEETTIQDPDSNEDLYKLEMQTVFEMAQEAGYTGTLEELIALFKGETGPAGEDGADGKDGETPYIGTNGNWWIAGVDLKVAATGAKGDKGDKGAQGATGPQGPKGDKGENGADGKDGADGKTPYIGENGNWWIDGVDTGVVAVVVSIASLEVDASGHLIATMTDGSIKDLGAVSGSSVGVKTLQINEYGQLVITFSNGIVVQTAPMDVVMEGLINGMTLNAAGEVIVHTSIGVDYNYGKIALVYMNENELIFRFENGDEMSLGTIDFIGDSNHEHIYGEYELGMAPTCTSIGYNVRTCTTCGNVDYQFVEATGHSFNEGFILEEAEGEKDGTAIFSCVVCKTVILETVPGIRFSEGLTYEMIAEKEEYRVIGIGSCTDTEIRIPEEHEGLPVTEIGEKAFFDCDQIVSVAIPETITKIADKAFSECDALVDVSMSDTVEIGTDVFRGSIYVNIIISHKIIYVEAKEANCYEPGHIAHYYCETCDLYYEDEEATIRIYDIFLPITHNFVSGQCTICGKIQDEVLIVAVDTISDLGKFPLGTLENAIGLPENINVTTQNGNTHALPIVWDLSSYNKSEAGVYTITGIIQAAEFYFAEGVSNNVYTTVEIVVSLKGTADIVFVLDISGSMGDEISNVKNNIIKFAQAIEAQGVSARWSAITYSDYTEYSSTNLREQTQVVYNGASEWFASAAEYKNAINGITLAVGGDAPEVAIDGLMMANTLTTRKDARTFYILLTDDTYKVNNHYGVGSMSEATNILDAKGVNVSVITTTSYMSQYRVLTDTTGGIMSNIYGNFSQDLIDALVPIIYEEVIA